MEIPCETLAKAVQLSVASRYFNNSEGCICAKRFLVAESLFDEFTKRFHVEQVDEEIVGQRLGVLGEDAVFRPFDIAGDPNAKLWANPRNSSRRTLAGSNAPARYASWS
jgi:hypothetical protein